MDRDNLYQMLEVAMPSQELTQRLRNEYFPEIVDRFNSEDSRRRFGLYQNERIPVNERNLTDVRTRMGVLIEFELARISNELLCSFGINDVFWSYVVANRFPDLEVRRNTGERLLRLEIKCLQCVAEEKSANFDTLKKDIDPNTDYVVVCLWDWFKDRGQNCNWDSVPKIVKVYVFHAYSLTLLRDTYWLNNPPSNLGGGYQGFDIRFAVTCADGVYSKEQGNYGKLTRIWKLEFPYRPVESPELLDTEREYLSFQSEIVLEGFKILAVSQLRELSLTEITPVRYHENMVGYESGGILYILSPLLGTRRIRAIIESLCQEHRITYAVVMTEKYKSTVYHYCEGELISVATNQKPKNVINLLNQSEN